jgi:hypothetical protein
MVFRTPVDIANRALQRIGAPRISNVAGFAENSRQAAECGFAYDKLRRAELRRNVWRFATRRAVLRPIQSPILGGPNFSPFFQHPQPTMFLAPALWSPVTTYYPGAVVADGDGALWLNNTPDNLNNEPGGGTTTWEQYFSPLTVEPFDPTAVYYAGEIVYNTIGDGIFRVYASQVNNNSDNPTVPTLWGATTFYIKDQIVIFYPGWSSLTTYSAGQGISFTDGNYYCSLTNGNLNHTPSLSSTFWTQIPLPPSVTFALGTAIQEWLSTRTYSLGTIVDYGGIQYVLVVSSSLNQIPLSNPASWAPITNGTLYLSLIDVNFNNQPNLAAANWSSLTTYALNATVNGSDNNTYTSLLNGNLGNNPVTDLGVHWSLTKLTPWTSSFAGGQGSNQFMSLTTALTDTAIFYPIGAGPLSQSATKNVYRLPANFLRKAPIDPKAGSHSQLGAPTALWYDDWLFEGNYIVTRQSDPVAIRFIADVVDVNQFDDMFCEGLACRVALEVCETLTQSTAKVQMISKMYDHFMTEARTVNAIETGAEEAPMDDYLAIRY